jgi:hypothetical protein
LNLSLGSAKRSKSKIGRILFSQNTLPIFLIKTQWFWLRFPESLLTLPNKAFKGFVCYLLQVFEFAIKCINCTEQFDPNHVTIYPEIHFARNALPM